MEGLTQTTLTKIALYIGMRIEYFDTPLTDSEVTAIKQNVAYMMLEAGHTVSPKDLDTIEDLIHQAEVVRSEYA